MPHTYCENSDMCRYAGRNGKSYWLTTNLPISTMALMGDSIIPYISRCSVCEAPSNVMAVHSQTSDVPTCPAGYHSMWFGYSFLGHTTSGEGGGGQGLMSPGSCLEDFRASPYVECMTKGTCQFFANSLSFWMRTLNRNNMFADPAMAAFKGVRNGAQETSRCQVCVKTM
jgi:integrin beta 8